MSVVAREADTHVPWWRVRVSPVRQAVGILLLMCAGTFFYAMLGMGMRFFAVSSISMEPTLHEADRIVAIPATEYHRGDLVVLKDPLAPKKHIVKRVVALPGDEVQVYGGALHVNGTYVSEPYRPEPIDYVLDFVVPEGEAFVLGDNANWSTDSHNWAAAFKETNAIVPGSVPISTIEGRVRYRYMPVGRIGPMRPYPIDLMLTR